MADLTAKKLSKRFGQVVAVDDFTLHVKDGEFVVLVGPSGCGKTTTLRLMAGLERPSAGEIHIGDRCVDSLPPRSRDVAMVFQDLALYPHRSVFGNLAFALQMRGVGCDETKQRVQQIAELLGVQDLLERSPAELSGGQQQRVALGRALVRRPAVFLLDEPFNSLDAPLRDELRNELVLLQRRLKTTTLHVTHDQVEAMQLGERVVVMHQGRIQQIDTPDNVYDRPANLFVARFFGIPPMSFFPATLVDRDGVLWIDTTDFRIPVPSDMHQSCRKLGQPQVTLGLRPEDIVLNACESACNENAWRAEIELVQPLGPDTRLELRSGMHRFAARVPRSTGLCVGDKVQVTTIPGRWHLFQGGTDARI